MKTYYATTKINASPETVWRILTDSASYQGCALVSGAMAPIMARCIPDLTPDLSEFVSALKRRVEMERDN